ncbi:hypothetical protein KR067_004343 [Drosophila pandora]|nr:hypothetical protein KR067_004343 [Drosophila pandora]
MKFHLIALLGWLGAVLADPSPTLAPPILPCVHAATAGYSYPPPAEVKFSITPGVTKYSQTPAISTYSENGNLLHTSVGTGGASYESTAGIEGLSHGGITQINKYIAPVQKSLFTPSAEYGSGITYAEKSPAAKYATVVPSGIEIKNLVSPALTKTVLTAPKLDNAYLPPAPGLTKVATYTSPGYSYSSATPGISKVATYTSPAPSSIPYYAPPVTTKVETYSSPGYTYSKATPGYSKVETYSSPGYSYGQISPGISKIATYSPSVSYSAPAIAKVSTYSAPAVKLATTSSLLATHGTGYSASYAPSITKYSQAADVSHQYFSKPIVAAYPAVAPALVAPAVTKIAAGYGGTASGAVSHQYVSKPAVSTYATAPAISKVATYAAPSISTYSSAPAVTKVATSYGGSGLGYSSGAVSHQYVSKPAVAIAAAPAIAKVATYAAPAISTYSSAPAISKIATIAAPTVSTYSSGPLLSKVASGYGFSGSGAVSHQYVSKPAVATISAAPAIAKVATYAAPAVSTYATAPAISKVASYAAPAVSTYSAAPVVTKVATSYGGSGAGYSSGAVSHQYVSKPAVATISAGPAIAKVATYAAPAISTYSSAPVVTKLATGYGASGHGAVSHQYVSKPAVATISAAPAIAKVATYSAPAVSTYATAPAVSKIATYAAPAVATKIAYSQAADVSHQYISKPIVAAYPAVAPALVAPAVTKIAASYEGSGHGAISHQYVSKPAVATIATAPAIAKVATYAAPAISTYSSAPAVTKVATSYGGSGLGYSSGAVSHQYVSKPAVAISAAPAIAKVATYAAPAISTYSAAPTLTKIATSYGGSGHGAVSHQYVSKPAIAVAPVASVAPVISKTYLPAAPALTLQPAKLATGYGVSGSGAVSHQYVSKPAVTTISAAPAIAKVATYAAPAISTYSAAPTLTKIATSYGGSGHGAVSHQYVSKPAIAVAPVASVAPVISKTYLPAAPALTLQPAKLATGYGVSGSGAVSHQYVSKPAVTTISAAPAIAKVASYAAPAISTYSTAPAISKIATYGAPAVSTISAGPGYGISGSGAVSHQYVSKPALATIAAAPAIAKVASYAAPAVSHISTGHAISSGPLLSTYSAAPAIAKVATGYGVSGSGAVSHQYVSKPAPAIAKVATTYSAPAVSHITTGPAIAKVASPIGLGLGVGYGVSGHGHGAALLGAPLTKLTSAPAYSLGGKLTSSTAYGIHAGKLGLGGGHDGGYYGAISLGHAAVSPALNYQGLLTHGSGLAPATASLGHLDSSLSGYSHGVGGIGPLGAGFYRYAPSVSALSSHAPLPATAYLKSAPVAQPALLKVVPEKHLEHFVSF